MIAADVTISPPPSPAVAAAYATIERRTRLRFDTTDVLPSIVVTVGSPPAPPGATVAGGLHARQLWFAFRSHDQGWVVVAPHIPRRQLVRAVLAGAGWSVGRIDRRFPPGSLGRTP